MTLQFYSEHVACDEIFFVNEDTALEKFMRWCGSLKADCQHVIYIHNLEFDIVELFWGKHHKLLGEGGSGDFEFRHGKWRISGVFGGPYFAKISDGHHRTIYLIDTFSWYRGSLASAAVLFCPKLPKLKRIDGIGQKLFKKADSDFVDYAMRDAVIAYHIGCAIEDFHTRYDISQSLSVADMAARIFKRSFLNYEIPLPSREIIDASFASYHGGKNNITVQPGWYENVTGLDLRSAYPWACTQMPAYSNAKLYRSFRAKAGVRGVPNHGVYLVSGTMKKTPYPMLFTEGFKPYSDCVVPKTWVQGYEVNEALRSGEFKCGKIRGYFYDHEKDHQAPALRAYMEDFYNKKETERDKVLRFMYKLMCNSPTGKFIQTRKRGSSDVTDCDSGDTTTASDLVAGGMFQPWIASEITAMPRARMHRIEEKWSALHTATDGVFTQKNVTRCAKQYDDVLPAHKSSRVMGSISIEAEKSTLLLVRNKLYILYSDKATDDSTPSKVFKGKHIIKAAFHGFQSNATQLEKLVVSHSRNYEVNKPNKLRSTLDHNARVKKIAKVPESKRTKAQRVTFAAGIKTPNDFVKKQMTLKVGPLRVQK